MADTRKNFTDNWVKGLRLPASGRDEYFDAKAQGLSLRVSPKGAKYPKGLKTWYAVYRVRGRTTVQRMKLGRYPDMGLADAREQADEARTLAGKGIDPLAKVKADRAADTFAEIASLYVEKHAKAHKRSWKRDAWYVKRYLNPKLGNIRASSVTRADCTRVLDPIRASAPIMANRVHEVLRRVYSWAIGRTTEDRLLLPETFANPAKGIERAKPVERDRVLNETELAQVWRAIGQQTKEQSALFRLRVLTAARGGELRAIRGQDIAGTLHGPVWTIPGAIAKGGRAVRVPLSRQAVAVLCEYTGKASIEEIAVDIPGPLFAKSERHPMMIYRTAANIRELTGVQDWRPHDLRRTSASLMADLGVSRVVVGMILGHTARRQGEGGPVTHVYERSERFGERMAAVQALADHIDRILERTSTPAEVLPITAKAS